MKSNQIIAIIPARSGSKSVKDKNIVKLNGYPLIAYSIAAAKISEKIDRVIVSTDSEYYAKISRKYGAEVPFIRPREISEDGSTDKDFFDHALKWFSKNEKNIPEYWIHLRPTTPLRDPKIIDEAIDSIKENESATSLRSGHPCPESPFKWFFRDENGLFSSLLNNSEQSNLPKEEFQQVYIPDGYVDILKTSHLFDNENLHGDKMIGFISPVCDEIDSKDELEYIRYRLSKEGSALLSYLERNYKKEQ